MANDILLFGRVIKATIQTSNGYLKLSNNDLELHFEVPFDDDAKPNLSQLKIYNLTKTTISRIKKNQNVSLTAGYKDDYGLLVEGKIASVLTKYEGVDKATTVTFKEGTDYSRIKVTKDVADPAKKYFVRKRVKLQKPIKTTTVGKNGRKYTHTTTYKTIQVPKYRKQTMQITFAKGTTGKQIITKLTKILGIKLAEFELPRNKVYKNGYKVTGQIEDDLATVVKDCGASMYWRRGKMVIRSIEKGNDEKFVLSESTGLIEPPEQFEDDNEKGYTVRCLLQHRITVASIIQIKSSTCNGTFRVRSGKHYHDGNEFLTEFEVI